MNKRIALPSTFATFAAFAAFAAIPLMASTAAAAVAVDSDTPGLYKRAGTGRGSWLVRAEGSMVGMHDNWLNIPMPEVGLTVGRDVVPGLSVELSGSVREPGSDERRSWSAMALGRVVLSQNATRRHALTLAGGPFIEMGNVVHGNMPFAHTELAYVYRSPMGLTVLAGGGLNFALARSSYVTPPPPDCGEGDSPSWCFYLGPDAQEIHTGDATVHMRLAFGWQF